MATAVAASGLPMKRRFETNEQANPSRPVYIELSDSESESSAPAPKRPKSHTPVENGYESQPSHRSRATTKTHAKPQAARSSSTTVSSRAPQTQTIQNGIPKRSPFKSFSVYSGLKQQQLDATANSSPSPPDSPTSRDKRPSFHQSGLSDRIKEARQANAYTSPYAEPRENGLYAPRGDTRQRSRSTQRAGQFDRPQPKSPKFTLSIPRPKTPDRVSPQPARRSTIVVEIDSPTNILKAFQEPLPKSRSERKDERKQLWSQLKLSTAIAHKNPKLVEQYFGQTGFSEAFTTEDEGLRVFMRQAASQKKKQVNRSQIGLDIGPLEESLSRLSIRGKLIRPPRTAREILTSRFDENVQPPLTFSNEVNLKRLNGKFQFIDRYIIGDKVKLAPTSTNKGCDCTDCSLSTCLCFTKEVKDGSIKVPSRAQLETYIRRPDGIVVLSDQFLQRELDPSTEKYEVTECNEFCQCGPGCYNRVVGNGRTVPLEIFQTDKCGFGVRSACDIVKGQFIELYLGEVITEIELNRREDAEHDDDPAYIYSLDWFDASKTQNTRYHVDGKYFGSAMRFVNHSCNPNARCFPVQIHKEDRKVYHLAFFAIRDIEAGVEIRIDYHSEGKETAGHPELEASGQFSEDVQKCYCGEKNCRGIVWTPGVKARRRRREE